MTLRLFLMRWFHWSVEEFEELRNPGNGQIVVMQRKNIGRYGLITELVNPTVAYFFLVAQALACELRGLKAAATGL